MLYVIVYIVTSSQMNRHRKAVHTALNSLAAPVAADW